MNPSPSSMALVSSSSFSSSSSSSSSKRKRDPNSYGDESVSKRRKNDVCMNYSFKDIGKSFISHLLASLRLNGFSLSDYSNLRVGHDARSEVFKAIDESEISLVVFSPNYAASKECLDELVHIARYTDQRKVLPVFFNVEPSDVRNQDFKEPFEETVKNWKHALQNVGQLCGLSLKDFRNEAELVLEIVNQIGGMLSPQDIHVTDHPIGIRSRAEELISKLRLDCEDVLVVGVFGLSGIGKTTIVKATYNKIVSKFQVKCFLEDIHRRYNWRGDWKFKLKKDLISQLNKDDKVKLLNDEIAQIQNLISGKKTLLVLDDVQNIDQLEGFGINSLRFFKGSRIIVTTRDADSLSGIPHTSYHTRLLNERESQKLFIRLMFARDEPVHAKFVEEVVARAGGLPLVLKVWSRHFTQYKEHLPAALKKLKQIPHGDVQKQLQMSYDSLSPESKNLFLDIACFFNGMKKGLVFKVLNDESFSLDYEIEKLAHKFLVENQGTHVSLAHVIEEMGHEVIRQEDPEDPGKRTRLMDRRDVVRVFREYSGTDSVRSIKLDSSYKKEPPLQLEAFKNMRSLRFIKLNDYYMQWSWSSNDDDISACFSFKQLKYLEWHYYPCKSLDNIDMGNVVVIKLEDSKLEKLWEGVKNLKKLKILNVGSSSLLTKACNFIGLENLEKLKLPKCENLEELDSSIGCLQKLVTLDLADCKGMKKLPWEMIGKLTSLQKLDLCHCSNIPEISHEVGSLVLLKHLNLSENKFKTLPNSICQLHQLTKLELSYCDNLESIPDLPPGIEELQMTYCENLVNLPSNIEELQNLMVLSISDCYKLGSHVFTQVTGLTNLQGLYMRNCNVSEVSSGIGNLVSLRVLDLSGNEFSSLPNSFNNLSQLWHLLINNCDELELLPPLPSQLTHIEATNCWSLDLMTFVSMQNTYIFHSKVFTLSNLLLPSAYVSCDEEEPLMTTFGLEIYLSEEEVPHWCTYGNSGNVISFVAPIQSDHSKICGIILCVTRDKDDERKKWCCPVIYNKTKETSHQFDHVKYDCGTMMVMLYPLNDTTLVVEASDTVEVQFSDKVNDNSSGWRLVYGDDDDSELVLKDVRKPTLSLLPLSS